jgi:flagella basal body P-ring formation protein FlgA
MIGLLRKSLISLALLGSGQTAWASDDVWIALRTMNPGDIVTDGDVQAAPLSQLAPDAMPASRSVKGLQVKRRIYLGRPVGLHDVGQPMAVKPNSPIEIRWQTASLLLTMQGMALEGGAVGDEIRVLNPSTSRSFRATVTGDGTVEVKDTP